ncbi:MAG TPA: toll/interleukin-1 receptor domain-containing protein [Thermoanaerobaculia bacterium]|nr:toll/interleukin-1 receptor domain-containing protein [Thermoanaerobaculia bacterium]
MPMSAVILFAEEDRAVAEAVRSHLAINEVTARLAEEIGDVRQARVAVAVVSAAPSSPEILPLIEEAVRLRIPVFVLRLDRAPLPRTLSEALDGLPDLVFDAASALRSLSLHPLTRRLLGFLTAAGPGRPTRGGFGMEWREEEEIDRSFHAAAVDSPETEGAYSVPTEPDDPPRSIRLPKDREPPDAYKISKEEAPPEPPTVRDNVHFSAYAPPTVPPGARFLLSVWAYLNRDKARVEQLAGQAGRYREVGYKGSVKLARGSEVTVYLDLPGFEVDAPTDTLAWEGEIGNCGFSVRAPDDLAAGRHVGTAQLLVAGVQVGRLLFEIEVGARWSEEKELPSTFERVRTMFASYSTEDRAEVLRFRQGAQAAGVDVFVDVLSLREGDDWPKRLEREVVSRDRFCLFWSADASTSEWVEKEWRAAYAAKGIAYIHPVPLADPRDVPPPPELGSSKHFNDLSQIVIAYEKLRKR